MSKIILMRFQFNWLLTRFKEHLVGFISSRDGFALGVN